MIVSVKEILDKAKKGGYAVGAFNTINLETTRAIVEAAKEMRSPVIIQITEKTMEYAGGRGIFQLVKNEVEFYAKEVPIGIHLDHGKSFEIIERAIEIGFTSVMYDGSRKDYPERAVRFYFGGGGFHVDGGSFDGDGGRSRGMSLVSQNTRGRK